MTVGDTAFGFGEQTALGPDELSDVSDVVLKPAQKKGGRVDPSGDQSAELSRQYRESFEQNLITTFRDLPDKFTQLRTAGSRLSENLKSRESGVLRKILQKGKHQAVQGGGSDNAGANCKRMHAFASVRHERQPKLGKRKGVGSFKVQSRPA